MGLTEWNRIYLHYTVIGGIEYEIHTVSQCDEVNSDYTGVPGGRDKTSGECSLC